MPWGRIWDFITHTKLTKQKKKCPDVYFFYWWIRFDVINLPGTEKLLPELHLPRHKKIIAASRYAGDAITNKNTNVHGYLRANARKFSMCHSVVPEKVQRLDCQNEEEVSELSGGALFLSPSIRARAERNLCSPQSHLSWERVLIVSIHIPLQKKRPDVNVLVDF